MLAHSRRVSLRTEKERSLMKRAKIIASLLGFVLFLGLLAAGWVWFTLHWSYSDGERTGYVQKLSRKGWICKTWEGEIAMVTMPGAIPEKFEFTVRDEAIAEKINAAAGHRVALHYQQHKFIPSTCFGETEYFIDGIRDVEASAAVPPPSVEQGKLIAPPSGAASAPAPIAAPASAPAAQ
jgi:hypothetical protein